MRAKQAAPQRAHGVSNRVRIIGGQYRRRLLDFPGGAGLRPTPDRVRETLFNWLGQDLPGWACLDLFAGSGALGFEAASRGAGRVVMIERDRAALDALEKNRAVLGAGAVEILRADAPKAVEAPSPEKLAAAAQVEEAGSKPARTNDKGDAIKCQQVPVDFIAKVLDDLSEEDDWIQLGTLGQNISKLRPAFDPRLYGCKKLSELIANQPRRFDLESRGSSATGGKDLYVRLRKPGKH